MKTARVLIVAMLLSAMAGARAAENENPATPAATDTTLQQGQTGDNAGSDLVAAAEDTKKKREAEAAKRRAAAQLEEQKKAEKEKADKEAADKAAAVKAAADRKAAEKAAEARIAAQKIAEQQEAAKKLAEAKANAEREAIAAAEAAAAERRLAKRLAIASAILSGLAVVLLILLILRSFQKPKQEPKPEEEINRRLNGPVAKLENALQLVNESLQASCDAINQKLAATTLLTPEHLTAVATALHDLREQVGQARQTVEQIATQPAPPASGRSDAENAAFERKILDSTYKAFCANRELSTAVDAAVRENTWIPLIDDLNKVVPADLKPTFDAVIAPCKEHWNLVQKIGTLVPKVIERNVGDLPAPDDARRAREYASVLQSAQSGDGATRLTFRFKSWVTDNFLTFADLYLQRYQQTRASELQTGVSLVRQLLGLAAVEPIDVVPGETTFDGTRHIGRSTSNDPHVADGVITGVVRNGFVEGGQQVIRRPEVIVNRNR